MEVRAWTGAGVAGTVNHEPHRTVEGNNGLIVTSARCVLPGRATMPYFITAFFRGIKNFFRKGDSNMTADGIRSEALSDQLKASVAQHDHGQRR